MGFSEEEENVIESKILRHKAQIKNDIAEALLEIHLVSKQVKILGANQTKLEEGHRTLTETLKDHSKERSDFNAKIDKKIDGVLELYAKNDKEDTERFSEIIDAVKKLTTTMETIANDTKNNTDFIGTVKRNIGKITSICIGVTGTLTALYMAYNFLEKNGVVFVIEKVNG